MHISFCPALLYSLLGLSKRAAGHGNNDRCFHQQVPPSDSGTVCGPVSVHPLHVRLGHHEISSLPHSQRQRVSYWPTERLLLARYILLTASVLPLRLTAIRDHSSGMKSLQKKAFMKRLLQASVVGDVPTWPPYFLSSILPLLPYLPVSHFQQLTSQQVRGRFTHSELFTELLLPVS